jgi:hypothetical protein
MNRRQQIRRREDPGEELALPGRQNGLGLNHRFMINEDLRMKDLSHHLFIPNIRKRIRRSQNCEAAFVAGIPDFRHGLEDMGPGMPTIFWHQ